MAADEGIDFDFENRGILHFHHTKAGFETSVRVSELLANGGLERRAVTPAEIRSNEPSLQEGFYRGFYTTSDSPGGCVIGRQGV
jgi:D-amino-acid dehydrogenase